MTPRRPRLALVLLVLAQGAVAAVLLESLSRIQGWGAVLAEDSYGYLLVADAVAGEAPPADPEAAALLRYRLFNPLVPAAAALLGRAVGVEAAFLVLNLACWIGAGLAFHAAMRERDGDDVAFVAAALLVTSLPFVEWGLPVMVDAAAYLAAAVTLLLHRRLAGAGARGAVLLGLWGGAVLLVKPTLLTVVAFLGLAALLERSVGRAATIGAVAAAVAGGVWALLGLGPDDFFAFGSPRHRGPVYLATAAVFSFHWGLWLFVREVRRRGLTRDELVYLAAFFPPFLVFVHSPRLFFLAFPGVLPAVARGLAALARPRRALVLYVATSNAAAALHLFVMRTLAVRDLGDLRELLAGLGL